LFNPTNQQNQFYFTEQTKQLQHNMQQAINIKAINDK
jgi:hypothetical protein